MRRPDLAGHLQPLGRVGQIHAVQANLRYPASVEAAVRDADVVINLVGILFERGRQRFDAVQAFGAEQVALAAAAHGARMIHVSAIGADENSPSRYARTKAEGEKAVLAAMPDATIFRPSIMFGPEDDFFNRFAAMARILAGAAADRRRRDQIPAGVRRRRRARRSRARSTATPRPARSTSSAGRRCGPSSELMEYVLAVTERRRLLVPLPFALAKLQATFLQFLPKPLLTPDQVELLQDRQRGVASGRGAKAARSQALGIEPTAMEAIVPSYLWRFRKTGQFKTGRFA